MTFCDQLRTFSFTRKTVFSGVIYEFQVQQKNCVILVKALCYHLTSILEPNFNPEYCDMAFSWNSATEFCLWFKSSSVIRSVMCTMISE